MFVYTLILQTSFAQDYTRWGLPDGAKVRLGKGWISGDVAYSPDGSLLAVTSSIGIWLYDASEHRRRSQLAQWAYAPRTERSVLAGRRYACQLRS